MTKDTIIKEPPVTAVAEYSPIAAGLAAARARYADVVWDLTTTRGNEEARRARKELVSLRTGLEAKRKEIKAPLLAQAKLVDDEARRITAELLQLEEPIDELIKADERRREEERAAREAAEKARVAAIQAKIKTIMDQPIKAVRIRSSALLRTAIDTLAAQEIDDSFEEFVGEARAAHAQSLDAMREMLAAIEAQEAEAARLREEREAQDRAAAEAAARLAAQQAEIERRAAELRAQQEEAARTAAQAEAAAVAESNPAAEPEPEPTQAPAVEPVAETVVAPAPAPLHRAERPSDDEIIATLALHYRVHEATVIEWLLDMNLDAASARAAANL